MLCLLAASSALVARPSMLSSAGGSAPPRVAVTLPLMVAPAPPPGRSAMSTAELKQELIRASLKFRAAQEQQWEAGDDTSAVQPSDERFKSPLAAEGLTNVEVAAEGSLVALRDDVISLVESLAARNPTPEPFAGWRGKPPGVECPLDGTWKLLFTTGADATFRKTKEQGEADTFQEISAARGHFVNCVDFSSETSKLKGFRVVVAGVPLSADEVQLKFRRVKLLRRSRWLRTVIVPLPPSGVLRALSRWASRGKGQRSNRGAGFKLLYVDEELRMHLTFDGQYFVQLRPEVYKAALKAAPSASAAGVGVGRTGSPTMGFADWGKGDKVATASHILVKDRNEAAAILEQIKAGQIAFADAAQKFSTCGSAKDGGRLGSFCPGEMVPEFDAYCFDPETQLAPAIGMVDTEFGTHLICLEKKSLGVAEGKSQKIKKRRMLDTPDPRTGLRG